MSEKYEAITVEIAKLEMQPGDVLLVTPIIDLPHNHRESLEGFLRHEENRLGIKIMIGHRDFPVTLVKASQ